MDPLPSATEGGALRSPDAEWDALRARLEEFRRKLRAARAGDDVAALRTACAEGLGLLTDMERLVGRLATSPPPRAR
ncbi:MAG TPA: hypothetical protein VFN74_20935 [Chloroflexota bacterium]|jgi:hypothetical protein|nr:hypothetical protein [Chloroflexota bacterium]